MQDTKKYIYEKLYQEYRIQFKTQGDFADALGISKQSLNATLKKIEQNGNIAIDNFLRMCEVLHLDITLNKQSDSND